MASRELGAYAAETAALAAFLARLDPGDWSRATRCPPMTIRDLVAHLLGQADGIVDVCAGGRVEGEAEKDRLTWWSYDRESDAAETLGRVLDLATRLPDGPLTVEFAARSAAAVEAAAALSAGDPVMRTGSGRIRLSDYLATRVLEATIHAWDVHNAVGLDPSPTPEGLAITTAIMRGLLGADVRDLGIGEVDLALTGSGRRRLNGDERRVLGPLADRFPLLT